MDSRNHVFLRKTMRLMKVLWQHQRVEETTWEREDTMRATYPFLFEDACTLINAQKNHHIPVFCHVFRAFRTIISAFIALYLILGCLYVSGENGSVLRLCGGVKKYIGNPNPNVTTYQGRNVEVSQIHSPTSQHRRDLVSVNFK